MCEYNYRFEIFAVCSWAGAIRVNLSRVSFDGTSVFVNNTADYGGAD